MPPLRKRDYRESQCQPKIYPITVIPGCLWRCREGMVGETHSSSWECWLCLQSRLAVKREAAPSAWSAARNYWKQSGGSEAPVELSHALRSANPRRCHSQSPKSVWAMVGMNCCLVAIALEDSLPPPSSPDASPWLGPAVVQLHRESALWTDLGEKFAFWALFFPFQTAPYPAPLAAQVHECLWKHSRVGGCTRKLNLVLLNASHFLSELGPLARKEMILWQILLGSEKILSFFKAKVFSEYAKLSHSYALLKKLLSCFLTLVSVLSFLWASPTFLKYPTIWLPFTVWSSLLRNDFQ